MASKKRTKDCSYKKYTVLKKRSPTGRTHVSGWGVRKSAWRHADPEDDIDEMIEEGE